MMRHPRFSSSCAVLALTFTLSNCLYLPPDAVSGSLLDLYDYIVVGGGASGLVVANRLTEDPGVTVLVLEAGTLDTEGYTVMVPSEIGADLGTTYDWLLRTAEQEYLDGQTVLINQGKVVGGGTILNGMVWTRGSSSDYDSWDDLNANASGGMPRYGWRWTDLLPYFEKSENFIMNVENSTADRLGIQPESDVHGESGSVQVSFPSFIYPQAANFLQGMEQMGVPIPSDPNSGVGSGAFLSPSSMSAENQSRSDSRVAYLDPVIGRTNLHLATEQMVTRLLLQGVETRGPNGTLNPNGLQQAVGVEFAQSADGARTNITCRREVIMAAGAIFSPTLLQISGIGPRDVLESLNVSVQVDLPGVGANMNEHGMIHPIYSYTNDTTFTAASVTGSPDALDEARDEYYANRTGPLTAPLISTVAFPSMRHFADDWVEMVQNASQRNLSDTLPPNTPPTVAQGYLAQRALQLALLRDPAESAVEILADSLGTLSIAMQRPLSRGTVRPPQSADIFDLPVVDPRYCSDPFDCLILARGLLFNCALASTPPMAELQPVAQGPYFCPEDLAHFDRDDTNARMLELARQNLVTEFHPSGTTAMMPLSLGGVVDTDLLVYGTTNVRIVDAGIMPMVVGAHLQAAVYAIAERAADIIKVAHMDGHRA